MSGHTSWNEVKQKMQRGTPIYVVMMESNDQDTGHTQRLVQAYLYKELAHDKVQSQNKALKNLSIYTTKYWYEEVNLVDNLPADVIGEITLGPPIDELEELNRWNDEGGNPG